MRRRRRIIFVGAVCVVVLLVLYLGFVVYVDSRYSSGTFPLFPFGFFGVFLLLIIVLWVLRIAFWSTRLGGPGGGRGYGGRPPGGWDPAIVDARRRYARGEITREQFHQIVQDLRDSRGQGPPP